jgi:flavodoxin
MKRLVTFYSRTGNTRKIGKDITSKLKSNINEIIDEKNRNGFKAYFIGGSEALAGKKTKIRYNKKPGDYDIVIIGTPVWAGTMTPAVRTYLSDNEFKKVAFFCTCKTNQARTFKQMKELSKSPVATLELTTSELDGHGYEKKIGNFCGKLE